MKLNDLAKKAARHGGGPGGGAMEVEDMLRFAQQFGAEGADEIERLCQQHGWLREGLQADGTRLAPFARWAQVCAAWGRSGIAGVDPLLQQPDMAPFAIGLLEEIREPEVARALLAYVEDKATFAARLYTDPSWDDWQALSALNLMLALEDSFLMDAAFYECFLAVLKRAWAAAADDSGLQTWVLYAARGARLPAALDWAQSLKGQCAPDAESVRKACIRALKKYLAPDFKPMSKEQKRQLRRERAASE